MTRLISLRRSDTCGRCQRELPAGTKAWWDPEVRSVTCVDCVIANQAPPEVDLSAPIGTAGASAEREYERRRAGREARVRRRFPRLGGLILRTTRNPQSTTAWQVGSHGEQTVANRLNSLCEDGFVVIHDRLIAGTRANIDHIVVAPSGIHIIDAKEYSGKVKLRRRNREVLLYVGSRNRTSLVDHMARQVVATDAVVRDLPEVRLTTVTPVLCFVNGEWEWFTKNMSLNSVRITWPRNLVKILRRPGPLTREQIEVIGRRLAERLSAA